MKIPVLSVCRQTSYVTNLNNFTYDLKKSGKWYFTKPGGMDDDSAYFRSENPEPEGIDY